MLSKIKRAKAIKAKYEIMDERSLRVNGFRMHNSLTMQINWLYSEYVKVCTYCSELPVSKGDWLSQDIILDSVPASS